MTNQQRDHLREAWFPLILCLIAVCGLIVQGLSHAVPYVVNAVAMALD